MILASFASTFDHENRRRCLRRRLVGLVLLICIGILSPETARKAPSLFDDITGQERSNQNAESNANVSMEGE